MAARRLLALLLLASGALFAVGSQIERNTETIAGAKAPPAEIRHEQTPSREARTTAAGDTGGESSAEGAASERRAAAHSAHVEHSAAASRPVSGENPAEHAAELHREAKLFGINPEAVGLVVAAVLASVLLAAVVWVRPTGIVLIAIVGFGLVFAGFDVREVLHQIDESRTGLIVIAGALAGLHLLLAALAGTELMSRRGNPRPAPA
jgi:hypothetical protein